MRRTITFLLILAVAAFGAACGTADNANTTGNASVTATPANSNVATPSTSNANANVHANMNASEHANMNMGNKNGNSNKKP